MKKLGLWIALAAMIGSVAVAETPEIVPMLQQGTREVVIEGEYQFDSAIGPVTDLLVSYGYFFRDYFEVGGRLGLYNDDFSTDYRIGGFTEYNFYIDSRFVPFVGADIGWFIFDPDVPGFDSENTMFAGASGGVKYFLSSNIALSAKYTLLWSEEKVFYEGDKIKDTDHRLRVGMRFYF
ncbi:MAG TPA: outer membrane beta-barrel protein [Kiritimatiellia bacterium]|nr:outer membrane beta-barrel protein [Kiritimatiellia bacterium]HMO98208.1 outer membrane beta-barrel protein [Kiritimatiellia bacterium]HMP96474.1 outer membrane beta-barrel protein [Kiritimatiellia bacterium]